MKHMINIWTSILLLCVFECRTSVGTDHLEEKTGLYVTYNSAHKHCKSQGSSFEQIKSSKANQILWQKLRRNNKTLTWIYPRRTFLKNWQWLDNTTDGLSKNSGCGYFNKSNHKYQDDNCLSMNHGYICANRECKSCYVMGPYKHHCIRIGPDCYTFHCNRQNWFKASERCRAINASLIIAKDIGPVKELTLSAVCSTFWIGLRKEEWISDNKMYIGLAGVSYWKEDKSKQNGNCTVFNTTEKHFWWETIPCQSNLPYVCAEKVATYISYTGLMTTSAQANTVGPLIRDDRNMFFLFFIVLLVPIIVVAVMLHCRLITKSQAKKQTVHDISMHEEEFLLLPENGSALLLVKYDAATKKFHLQMDNLHKILLNETLNNGSTAVAVISICGVFRTGKSFLMNYILRYLRTLKSGDDSCWLLDQKQKLDGFQWNFGTEITTYGLWMWSEPLQITYPSGKKVAFLLVDTQGLFDAQTHLDAATMVALSFLLSSVQIYNVMKIINETDLKNIEILLETAYLLQEHVRVEQQGKTLQRFVFLVRDMTETLYGRGVNGGIDYLKNYFHRDRLSHTQKKTAKSIKDGPFSIECFLMSEPGKPVMTRSKEKYQGELSGLTEEFQKELDELVRFLFDEKSFLSLKSDEHGVGLRILKRCNEYVTFFNSGHIPRADAAKEVFLKETNELILMSGLEYFFSKHATVISRKKSDMNDIRNIVEEVKTKYASRFRGKTEMRKTYISRLENGLSTCIPSDDKTLKYNIQLGLGTVFSQACNHYEQMFHELVCKGKPLGREDISTIHKVALMQAARMVEDDEHKKHFLSIASAIYQSHLSLMDIQT